MSPACQLIVVWSIGSVLVFISLAFIIMNSQKLSKKHGAIYEGFYTTNDLVVSAPFLFGWTGNNDKSLVSIKQKLPLRLHIGLKKMRDTGIKLGKIHYYSQDCEQFYKNDFNYAVNYGHQLEQELNQHF